MKTVKYLIISISDEVLQGISCRLSNSSFFLFSFDRLCFHLIIIGLIQIEIWMNQDPSMENLLQIVPTLKYLKGVAEQFQTIDEQ